MTRERVDQYIQWYESRPEWVCIDRPFLGFRSCRLQVGFFYAGSPMANLASRVASILGLDQVEVKRAFDETTRSSEDELHREKLGQHVEEGCLTQQQADQYFEWYRSRPQGIIPGRQHCNS